jgi:cell division protein FtsB
MKRPHLPRVRLRAGRVVFPILATAVFAVVLVVAVFPTRSYLSQRRAVASAAQQLQQLQRSNAAMTSEAARLQTTPEIERRAAQDFGMAMPGQEVYHVLPAPQPPLTVPRVWPFQQLQQRLDR